MIPKPAAIILACNLLILTSCSSPEPEDPATTKTREFLTSFVGKDIAKLPEGQLEAFQELVDKKLLIKDEVSRAWIGGSPRLIFANSGNAYVWHFGSPGAKEFLILLNPTNGFVPGAAHAWVFVVDASGKVLAKSDFETGWRMQPKSADYTKVRWLSSPVIIQEMEVGEGGDGPRKIYIAFDDRRPAVVKLEAINGAPRKMDYFALNRVVGPPINKPTRESILGALGGNNEVRRLEALVWLSGTYDDPFSDRRVLDPAEKAYRELHRKLISDADIQASIERLRLSSNEYVQQLAKTIVWK